MKLRNHSKFFLYNCLENISEIFSHILNGRIYALVLNKEG
jgi:hypothetical protein